MDNLQLNLMREPYDNNNNKKTTLLNHADLLLAHGHFAQRSGKVTKGSSFNFRAISMTD